MSRSQMCKHDLIIWASLYLCPTNCQLLATPLTGTEFPRPVERRRSKSLLSEAATSIVHVHVSTCADKFIFWWIVFQKLSGRLRPVMSRLLVLFLNLLAPSETLREFRFVNLQSFGEELSF